MIVFDLVCQSGGHRFEGWFGSSGEFADQQSRGLVCCPECGDWEVGKAPMAPNVGRKGNQVAASQPVAKPAQKPTQMANAPAIPPAMLAAMHKLAAVQAEALKTSTWVGDTFAEDVRAMHYGERDHALVHGQASADEAQDLLEEGIAIAPLLVPIAPPDEIN